MANAFPKGISSKVNAIARLAYFEATYLALAGPSDIHAGWGIETNGRFMGERPLASAGPPLGG